jgi:hypothetical protein
MDLAMAEGFAFIAMARALLREPDLVQRIKADPRTRSLCVHCNKCMPTIYRGTHCVLASDAPTQATGLPSSDAVQPPVMTAGASRSAAICAERLAIAMNMASPRSVRPTSMDAKTAMSRLL